MQPIITLRLLNLPSREPAHALGCERVVLPDDKCGQNACALYRWMGGNSAALLATNDRLIKTYAGQREERDRNGRRDSS